MRDFIGISRCIIKHWIYQDAEYFQVWFEMLHRARYSYEPEKKLHEGQVVTINRGEFIFGRTSWSKRLTISERRLRTLIKKLIKDDMIEVVKKYNKFTHYKIKNYDRYNQQNDQHSDQQTQEETGHSDQQNDQQVTSKRPASDQQVTTQEDSINTGGKQLKESYKDIYDFYISLGLKKHRAYTDDIKKAIESAMKNNKYDGEYCKTLLERHKKVVEITKNSEYPVKVRGIAEFFGVKVKDAKHLICSEYEEGGAKYDKYLAGENEKPKDPFVPKFVNIDIKTGEVLDG